MIAFAADRDGGRMDLYLINADGSKLTQLTHTSDDEISPFLSPDGIQIEYSYSKFNNNLNDLYIIEFENGSSFPITSDNFDNWWTAGRPW